MAISIEYVSRRAGTPGIATKLRHEVAPIHLLRCGLYADIGQEVL